MTCFAVKFMYAKTKFTTRLYTIPADKATGSSAGNRTVHRVK